MHAMQTLNYQAIPTAPIFTFYSNKIVGLLGVGNWVLSWSLLETKKSPKESYIVQANLDLNM